MTTENDAGSQDTGLDDISDGADAGNDGASGAGGADDAGGQEGGAGSAAAGAEGGGQTPKSSKQQKRDLFKELNEVRKREREAQRERAAATEQSRQLQATLDKLSASIERSAPRQPGPQDEAFKRVLTASKRIDPQNDDSIREYHEALAAYSGAAMQKEFQDLKQQLQQLQDGGGAQPQRPPMVQKLLREFDWADGDDAEAREYQDEIAMETRRIARRRGIDLREADGRTRFALMREGAIAVAKANGIPVGNGGRDATATGRFTGTGGRTGAPGGGGGGVSLSDKDRQDILDATSQMGGPYRNKDGSLKTAEERIALFTRRHMSA